MEENSTVSYTIVASNAGPSDASGAVFKDAVVANLSVSTVTCGTVTSGAICPTVPNTTKALMQGAGIVIPTLPSGGSVTFTVTGTAGSGAQIANTATLAPPSGTVDPSAASATDTDAVNRAPAANAGPDQSVNSKANVTLDGSSSSDPDGDSLGYSWAQTSGPAVTLSNIHAVKPTFTAPAGNHALVFSLIVNDGTLDSLVADTVTITVGDRAPVANAGPDQSVNSNASVTLDGSSSSDPDGDSLSYGWAQTSGPAVTLSNIHAVKPTFTAPAVAGALTFKLTVSDGSLTSSDSVGVTVSGSVIPAVKKLGRPQTTLLAMTIGHVRHTAFFRFSGSGGKGKLKFECRLDTHHFSPCRAHKSYKHLNHGRHVFRVRAKDAAGLADLTLVTVRFKV